MQNEDGNISPLKAFFKNKWVKLILVLDVIAIIAIIAIMVFNSTKTATVSFDVAPVDAKIQLNGQGDYKNGSYQVHPGTYEVTISHDGLETKTFTVDLPSGYVATVATFLTGPNNDLSFYELKDNYLSYQKLASIASAENNITTDHDTSAEEFIADFGRKISILEVLPIKGYVHADPAVSASTAGFTIRDGRDREICEKTTCLLVNYYGTDYEESVMEKIKEAGYDPVDYQIFYERYN